MDSGVFPTAETYRLALNAIHASPSFGRFEVYVLAAAFLISGTCTIILGRCNTNDWYIVGIIWVICGAVLAFVYVATRESTDRFEAAQNIITRYAHGRRVAVLRRAIQSP